MISTGKGEEKIGGKKANTERGKDLRKEKGIEKLSGGERP